MRKLRRFPIKAILITIIVMLISFAAFLFMASAALSYQMIMTPRESELFPNQSASRRDVPSQANEQNWHLKTASGLRLRAVYFPAAQPTTKTIIILHGYGEDASAMSSYDDLFHRLGYNTLTPDARGFGQSQGKVTTYGYWERQDVEAWSRLVLQKQGSHTQIALFGVSMGASTALMATSLNLPKQVKAIIADSAYTNLRSELKHESRSLLKLPSWAQSWLLTALAFSVKRRLGFSLDQVDSVTALRHNFRPVLLIHGTDDQVVPFEMALQNARATKGPVTLWRMKKVQHAEGLKMLPVQYEKHVDRFLTKYLH